MTSLSKDKMLGDKMLGDGREASAAGTTYTTTLQTPTEHVEKSILASED